MGDEMKIEEVNSEINALKAKVADFIESAAHDLHAPLRKLSVLVERLVTKHESDFDDDAKQYADRIQSCVQQMKSLIDGLRGLAIADVQDSSYTECDLNTILKQTIEILNEEIAEKNVLIDIGELPIVRGNEFQYRQLFKNLLDNSIKFASTTVQPKLSVHADTVSRNEKELFNLMEDKKYFRIEIEDNGIGFKQHYAEKIFEPFVRLHPRGQYDGNGLGLAICKKIVTTHKGTIYAEGNENRGSRFVLILPESP